MEHNSGNNVNTTASNVARAIVVASDWNSTPDDRKAAVAYLDSIKAGDIGVLAGTSFLLVKKDWSSEIRLYAFKMLQHLVRLRWEELSPTDRRNFSNVTVELMSEFANPCEEWALKSQTAALVAEMVRREGLSLWQELLPSIVSLSSSGPAQAELVSMMLRWLPEDITVHNEDLEGDRRRWLLRGLTESLPEVLPLLYTLLEKHFGAALSEISRQQLDIAKQHAAAVTATLNAINAYAEWAPFSDLAKYGIIRGCGFLLSSPDFRLHACEFFKLVSPRKRPFDASATEFDSAMTQIFEVLMHVSEEFLQRSSSNPGAIDESEFEFAEYICEGMVLLGSSNLQCIAGNRVLLSLYLQEMLGFFKHFKLALHFQSLLFWVAFMRDLMSKPKSVSLSAGDGSATNSVGSGLGPVDNEKNKILNFLHDDLYSAMLDISFQRMLKREKIHPETVMSLGPLELWSDDFEGKGDFGQYRSKLLELVRFVASYKPLIAATKISERTTAIIESLLSSPMPTKGLSVMESVQLALETVVSTVFEGSNEFAGGSLEVHVALCRVFEGLLKQLLALKWAEPALVQVLGHYLDALGPFLKYFPDAVGSVINKLFELLTSLPFVVQDPSTNSARHARLQICTSFIRIAKAADKSILPHMKGIADTMALLQRQGCLLRGEHNILGEAFLVMATTAGIQQQQEVLAWLLEPLSQQWTQLEWQNNYLSEPLGLVRLCSDTSFMWSIFHTVTFFEKALKRSGIRKGNLNLQSSSIASSTSLHPMASHLSWMLPPLLRLLRAIHSLWSPAISQTLPKEMKAAMIMSEVERFSLLGEGNPKTSKGTFTFTDGSHTDINKEGSVDSESDIRNWLKGIRDSGYNVLGLSATIGDSFFKGLDAHSVCVTLMENIQSMEFRHIRQIVHSILIPLVKSCPSDMRDIWLEKLLHPLLFHTQQALSCSWSSLLHDGRAKVPDNHGTLAGSDLKVEVMEEKLLRDLTREICALLSAIASPVLNGGLPPLEQSGHINRVDMSSLKDLDTFAANSMVGFLLNNKDLAVPALRISLEAFTWTDCESVTKISSFCAAVVQLAALTNSVKLREFVSKDLFSAIVQGLSLESNATVSADLVGLCREIFIYLCNRDPAPRQVLLSLPSITPQDLLAFEEALTKTSSSKEQKQHMKSLLMLATGNKLKALAAQKSVNVIINVSSRPRSSAGVPEAQTDEADSLGLAAIL
ncbi:ARM repeat superfamily protein isoform 1 [Tripterygium wilfordii]|uniref:ARM repeat superfamily protein isoform 1 n=1 Tax=Tripterygium wilfordii TaxID=458696 RepID=A0A7J7D2K5_TRIWF|nr:protein HASTY 1 [Tripterygium wilfordii]KAF5740577.1 ARM repeat superfamily protein isoform 1 [Tripterygium wilfordii]